MSESEQEALGRFKADVIDPSMTSLVILQFTAEWCGPCKQLSPILDKLAGDYANRGVILKKIDVDADKIIAAQFQIQSIPTVYALFQGQPVADLTQYRTEGQLTQVLDQILKQLPIEGEQQSFEEQVAPLIEMADEMLEAGQSAEAEQLLAPVFGEAPGYTPVTARLARAYLANGKTDEARTVLATEGLDDKDAALIKARALLEMAEKPKADTGPLEARLADNPDDHESRLALADALAGAGDRDGAADQLLDLIQRDRDWNEGAARAAFLKLLEAAGLGDPWASAQRRRLSAILFT